MPRHAAFRFRGYKVPPVSPYTLYFDIRPDITSGNAGDTSTQQVWVNGNNLGTFTSNGANAAGPAVWVTKSVDITSYVRVVGSGLSIEATYISGADTGYFRNIYVQDGNGTIYTGGYPYGTIYTPAQLAGGASEYIMAKGGSSASMLDGTNNTYVAGTEADSREHYYIPAGVIGDVTNAGQGLQTLRNGAAVYNTGSLNQRISFTWHTDRSGSGQQWGQFQVRNSSTSGFGSGYSYQKSDNSNASDYALINTSGGQTGINGLPYYGIGFYVVQIVGTTFSITRNGTSIGSYTFNNSSVEAAATTYCYVGTAGGSISNLYIEGL